MRLEITNSNHDLLAAEYEKRGSPLFILCHGYGGNKDFPSIVKLAELLNSKGYSTVRFDFTGNGESRGSSRMSLIQWTKDIGKVTERFKGEKQILWTPSFAAMVGIIASGTYHEIDGLITVNGLFSLKSVGMRYHLYRLMAAFDKSKRAELDFYRANFRPESICVPVLVMHGRQDRLVSPDESYSLYDKLRCEKDFQRFDSDHYMSKDKHVLEASVLTDRWITKHKNNL